MAKRYIFLFLFSLPCVITLPAQTLTRRPFMGIQLEAVTPDIQRIMGLPDTKGVLISRVFPGSTGEKTGFKISDVLLSLNGKELNGTAEAIHYIASQESGKPFTYVLLRNHKQVNGNGVFEAIPEEKYPDLEVVYTQVKTGMGDQRLLIYKTPGSENKPLLFFIGGIGCYSLDSPLDTTRAESQMLRTIARSGYVCALLEKPGMGDNTGKTKNCNETGFLEEAEGYAFALKALKIRREVDSTRVYLFGHSMGGVMAPLIAGTVPVKGIIAYGTIGSSFLEYLNKTRRTIAQAYHMPPDSTDDFIKDNCACAGYYFVEDMSTAEATAKNKVCKDYLGVFDYRSRKYNRELYALNIPRLWKSFSGKALLIWGEADYISAREDHEIIAGTVNYFHPGNGSLLVLPHTNHALLFANNFSQAATNPGSYNPEVAKQVLAWLKTA
jgi:pimeloyl-ACP methyl ester carboxylesterase